MKRPMLLSKIHRATVSGADLEYVGSITLDQNLMDAAEMIAYQKIEIYNVTRGTRLSTYLIPGERGEGDCCLNGAAAHLVERGDKIIICAYGELEEAELADHEPRVVIVGEDNTVYSIKSEEPANTKFAVAD